MAGGFDMWRFHKCNEALIPELRKNGKWVVFWLFACFVMFFCLGAYPSVRSESRWFEVVREMLVTGDWLHPRINGQPYFDKPLVSYWFAAIVSKLAGGRVTELSVRLPSAVFALAGLGCIISIARKFYSERTAYLAGWLLLSTYSFIVWGRLAEADMEQTVFIVMAVTVYLHHRETASFWAYFAFWACCAVGAQTKGLPALVIPPALAAIDCVVRKAFRRHLNWKSFLAFFLGGLCLYAVPFVLEAVTSDNYGASGIVLVFRENLVRVFNPWDHNKDPFYIYFEYLPILLIPWTPFFVFAVIDYIRELIRAVAKRGTASVEDLSSRAVAKQGTASVEDLSSWLFASIVFIFVLFSASRSRRLYYILPAVPWCVLFTAAWFSEPVENGSFLRRITDRFLKVVDVLTPAAAAILILLPAAGIAAYCSGRLSDEMVFESDVKTILLTLTPFALVAGIAWLFVWRRSRKELLHEGGEGVFAPSADPLNRMVPFVALAMFAVFSLVIPVFSSTDTFEPTAPFLRKHGEKLKEFQAAIPGFFPERTAFFGDFGGSELTYYMDLQKPIPQFWLKGRDAASRTFTDDTTVILGLDEFREFLNKVREQGGGAIITRGDCLEDLKNAKGGKELYDMLNDEHVFARDWSPLNLFQEQILSQYRAQPGSPGVDIGMNRYLPEAAADPKLMKKIKKLEGRRVIVFYNFESVPQLDPAASETERASQVQADPAAHETEGTPQS